MQFGVQKLKYLYGKSDHFYVAIKYNWEKIVKLVRQEEYYKLLNVQLITQYYVNVESIVKLEMLIYICTDKSTIWVWLK